jgi:hypothetical protein
MQPPNHLGNDEDPSQNPLTDESAKVPTTSDSPSGPLGYLSGLSSTPPPITRTMVTPNRRWLIFGGSVLSALMLFLCTLAASAMTNRGTSMDVTAKGNVASKKSTATTLEMATPTFKIFDDALEGSGHFQFHYHGTWQLDSRPGYYATTSHYSDDAKTGYVNFIFVGSRIQIIASKNPNAGIMGISLDNGTEIDKDGYSPTPTYQVIFYDSGKLAQSKHKVKIFVTGRKNPLATDVFINIDAAKVSM